MAIAATQAAQAYSATRPALKPDPGSATSPGEAFAGVARDFLHTMQQGEDVARASMAGKADPHALVQALAETELAIEAAVTVRDKVVEAYQEILRMPV